MSTPATAATELWQRRWIGPREVYLARHGRSVWNKTKRVSGQCDPPLSDTGRAQAAWLCEVLRERTLTAVYSSDLQRAVDTARPTAQAHGLRPRACAALREQHLGEVQGRLRDERDPAAQALWRQRAFDRLDFRMPGGGESYRDLEQRVLAWLVRTLPLHPGGGLLIVGHRNTNRVLLSALLRWPRQRVIALPVSSQEVYRIQPGRAPFAETIALRAGATVPQRTALQR